MTPPRILLVDDERSIRLTLSANLELADFEVTEADGAQQALELLGSQRFDLVLSDILMPGMTGVSLLQHIKQAHPELPVVLMTAYALDEQIKAAFRSGVYTVLSKAFDVERLGELLLRACRRPRVLVLDQPPQQEPSAALALQRAGLLVQVATSVDSARHALQAGAVDVGVVSLSAHPEQVQVIVTEMLRAFPTLQVVIVAGQLPSQVMAGLARSGVRSFLTRPVNGTQLVEMVAQLRAGTMVA